MNVSVMSCEKQIEPIIMANAVYTGYSIHMRIQFLTYTHTWVYQQQDTWKSEEHSLWRVQFKQLIYRNLRRISASRTSGWCIFFFNGVMDHVRGLYVCSENLTCKWCDGGLAKIHLLTDEAAAASQTVSKW